MGRFVDDIRRLESESNALHTALRCAFRDRHKSRENEAAWRQAAARFREMRSPLDRHIEQSFDPSFDLSEAEQREFMFDYVAVDPQFFRSGYVMERILRRIKRLDLTSSEKGAIRALLMSRIQGPGRRNFRDICKLVPLVQNDGLAAKIADLVTSPDTAVSARAKMAQTYFAR